MKSKLPSPGRLVLLALMAIAIFGVGGAATFVTLGVLADRQALAVAKAQDASTLWMTAADQFETLALAEPFQLPVSRSGDAAEWYWPDEPGLPFECGPPHRPRLFDDPAYRNSPEVMRESARCEGLDRFVEAAAMPEMNVGDRLTEDSQTFDPFVTSELFRGPERGFYALLARAHGSIESRDFRNAERDARAVVSGGRQFVNHSPDMYGVFMGVALMTAGLDHLRELYQRRGETARSEAALAARDSVDRLRRNWSRMLAVSQGTSAFPSLLPYTVAAAENEGLPLGLRRTLVVFLGYGHVGHFLERLLGPDNLRSRALARLERHVPLRPAVERARLGLHLSWFERREFALRWNL